jgi:hypothetical protein
MWHRGYWDDQAQACMEAAQFGLVDYLMQRLSHVCGGARVEIAPSKHGY